VAAAQAALATCQTAITGVLTGQQATAAAQQQLETLSSALNDSVTALTKAVQAASGGASTGGASTGGASTGAASTGGASTGAATTSAAATTSTAKTGSASTGPGATPVVASAATIVADEAAITAANAQLGIAQNDQNLGSLTSPIAGTVAAITMTPGAAVQAGSTTENITIIGDGGYTVSSTAALSNVTKLKVNQPVQIAVTSSSKTLAGTVSSIGLSNISTTSTTPSYTVTVAVTDKTATLLNGAAAQLKVTAATATSVLTVPTSAVHRTAQTYTVDVLKNGNSATTTVKVGASGAQETEITSGLTKGDVVILANIASTTIGTATPTTTTTTGTGLSGLSGSTSTTTGRTGGGGGGGGRGGGGAPAGG
jgi:multidrug efflux pump subunit AcrA (membrane-fusion protein)